MKEIVNERLTLATAFIGQYDNLVQSEIGARYAFEMISRINPRDRDGLDKAKAGLSQAEMNKLRFEETVEDITGLKIADLRVAMNKLITVITRYNEVELDLYKLSYLSPVFKNVLAHIPESEDINKAKSDLDERLAELPRVQQHHDDLAALVEALAATIGYKDISTIAVAPMILER